MPHDIAESIYCYLARDWGLARDALTPGKCQQLTQQVSILRNSYNGNKPIPYHKPLTRRAYLAAFVPRYAYILYACLNKIKTHAKQVLEPWHRREGVVCLLGGGPACEVFGLLDWLYENGIEPRYLRLILLDREGYWRSFHSYLFSELVSKHFRKTMVIPSYETIDFPVPRGARFDRRTVSYQYAQTSLLAEAKLLSVVNCLSEIEDFRGFLCHLHFLTHLAWESQLIVCADSNAKKRRPRISWVERFFDQDARLRSRKLLKDTLSIKCNWLQMGTTSARIFRTNRSPVWRNEVKRWVYIRKTC